MRPMVCGFTGKPRCAVCCADVGSFHGDLRTVLCGEVEAREEGFSQPHDRAGR